MSRREGSALTRNVIIAVSALALAAPKESTRYAVLTVRPTVMPAPISPKERTGAIQDTLLCKLIPQPR